MNKQAILILKENMAEYRLAKVATELNRSFQALADLLNQQGFDVMPKPTTKITEDMYQALLREFSADKAAKDEAKLQKKLAKSMLSNLCVKTANGYTELSWKMGSRKATIAELLSVPNGREVLRNAIAKAKGEGKEVLNTNIPVELM